MTTQRTAIFKPLGLELTRQMEAAMGKTPEDAGSVDLPPRPPETKEVIESKLIPCERCDTVVAMLIFAPNATDPGHFEDYARILGRSALAVRRVLVLTDRAPVGTGAIFGLGFGDEYEVTGAQNCQRKYNIK